MDLCTHFQEDERHFNVDARLVLKWTPPWRQLVGKSMVSKANSHTNALRIRVHLWKIDL